MIRVKRTYDPSARGDGWRVLVERLWPRGIKKESLDADAWLKEVAPSTELRKWFNHREERWEEFRHRYREELNENPDAWRPSSTPPDAEPSRCSTARMTPATTARSCCRNI